MQVKDCLKQNEDLRSMLDKLRAEQASMSTVNDRESYRGILESNKEGVSEGYTAEVVSLKVSHVIFSRWSDLYL